MHGHVINGCGGVDRIEESEGSKCPKWCSFGVCDGKGILAEGDGDKS